MKMFNITAKYCKVWKAEAKENMVLVDLSTSKKDKDGKYVNSKYFKVKFVGKCLQDAKRLADGDKINIMSGLIGKREYQGKYYDDVIVFEFEPSEGSAKVSQDDGFTQDDSMDDVPWT
jgi:hypothetical protein